MSTWKERVVEEYKQLVDKISNLYGFIERAHAKEVAVDETYLELLEIQLDAMTKYKMALKKRLEYLGEEI